MDFAKLEPGVRVYNTAWAQTEYVIKHTRETAVAAGLVFPEWLMSQYSSMPDPKVTAPTSLVFYVNMVSGAPRVLDINLAILLDPNWTMSIDDVIAAEDERRKA